MTFARRIAIGAIAGSLVPLLFAALIFANLREGTRERQQLLRAQEALALTALLHRLVIDMETGVRGFRIEGREAFLEPYNSAVAQYGAVRSRLDGVLGSEEERKILREIGEGVEHWRTELAEPRIAAIRASPPVATERGILLSALPESLGTQAGKQQIDALRGMFDELSARQRKRGEELIAERTRTDTHLSRLLWLSALGFSVLLFAGAVHFLRLFDRRMNVLFAGIAAVERGEYGPVALPGSDEPARIAEAFNRMVEAVGRSDDELHRQAGKLRESEERLDLALESAQMGAWDLDIVHDTAVRSLRHDQIFGYPSLRPEWSSEIFLTHVLPEDRELVQARFQAAFAAGQLDMECRILWPDQSVHWIAAEGHVYYNERREPVRMMGVVRDVSERKRAEQVLAERSVQLEGANRELEAFAYSVSHDLRAPLRAIDGFSQVLLEDHWETLEDSGRDALARVRAAAGRMSNLIDDMLKLSLVTRAELQRTRVDLSETARGVAAELARREPDRRVETRIAEGVTVEGDSALLKVLLENLLGNAFKFTSKRPEARVEFGVERQNGTPVYYVRDNGAGFDGAYVGKLFGAFQRLHSEAEFPGTGIGLATVKRIIHRHGGRVWAEGAVDAGATFRFTL